MGHIVLELTSLAYQPTTKSRERSGHPKRHVTCAMSEGKPADPAHTQDMHGGEDDGPLRSRIIWLSLMIKMTKSLVQPASRKSTEEGVTQLLTTKTLHPWFLQELRQMYQCEEEKDVQYGKTQMPHWNKRCQETRVIIYRMPRFFGKKAEGEALRNIINMLFDERNLRGFHLKLYHMSTALFNQRMIYLDIPGNSMTSTNTW